MKVLVAGASGLVGREVIRMLKARGDWVRTLSRRPQGVDGLRAQVDEVRLADATDAAALKGICDGIDVVISCLGAAVSPNAKERRGFFDIDVVANQNLIAEAKASGARRFVYVSVFSTPGYSDTLYMQAHEAVADALRGAGLSYAIVRPTGIFGALAEMVEMAKKGPLPVIGSGQAQSNPVHEADVAAACLEAADASTSPFEIPLGGPTTHTRRELVSMMFRAAGKKERAVPMPRFLLLFMAYCWRLFHPRNGQFLQFVAHASTVDCVAPPRGHEALESYLRTRTRQAS